MRCTGEDEDRPNARTARRARVSGYPPRERDSSRVTTPERGPREEKSVPKRTEGTVRSPGRRPAAAPQPPLPDLTGVSLRALRTCDDPAVTAAVESTLHAPEELSRVWRSSGTQGGQVERRHSGTPQVNTPRTGRKRGAIRSTSGPVHGVSDPPAGPGDGVGRHEPS